MRFIMPRLIGATVAAGVAALIVATIFKLLLCITILAGLATIISRTAFRRRRYMTQPAYGPQHSFSEYGQGYDKHGGNPWESKASSFGKNASQQEPTIVPIN